MAARFAILVDLRTSGLPTSDFRTSDFRLPTSGLRTSDFGLRTSGVVPPEGKFGGEMKRYLPNFTAGIGAINRTYNITMNLSRNLHKGTSQRQICEYQNNSIHYEIYAAERPSNSRVLFFNGSGATLRSSAPFIRALAKESHVLAHDQRGLGRTSTPEGPFTMAQYATDAVTLMDYVGWDTCTVIGISFGGMVAQEFAATFPSRVTRLCLMCTSAGGVTGSSYPIHELDLFPPEERKKMVAILFDTRFTSTWLEKNPQDAELIRMRQVMSTIDKSVGEKNQLEARSLHDVADRLHNITANTFVMAGRFDGIAPFKNSLAIAERIAKARVSIYEGGHLFIVQDPRAISDIRHFVATGVPGS